MAILWPWTTPISGITRIAWSAFFYLSCPPRGPRRGKNSISLIDRTALDNHRRDINPVTCRRWPYPHQNGVNANVVYKLIGYSSLAELGDSIRRGNYILVL